MALGQLATSWAGKKARFQVNEDITLPFTQGVDDVASDTEEFAKVCGHRDG